MSNVINIEDAPKTKQEKLELFCEALANGLTREAAYIAAGYSPHMAKANAHKFYRSNSEYIQGYIAEHVGTHAPTALKVILEVMSNKDEKGGVRLKAAQDVMDRAGFTAKQRIEITTKDVKEQSTEELENEIARIIAENPLIAAVLNPAKHVSE